MSVYADTNCGENTSYVSASASNASAASKRLRGNRRGVADDARDERVRELAPPASALVVGVAEQIRAARDVGDAHVEVVARTPGGRIWLGHEARDEPGLLGGLFHHEPKERQPVG